MSNTNRLLPPGFEDLEGYVEQWALPSFDERMQHRAASRMSEIRHFYDAMQPRAEAMLAYLAQFPLDDMPEDALRLLRLTFMLAQTAMAVEIHGRPHVPHASLPILVRVRREQTPA
jgi:hypothetical protein